MLTLLALGFALAVGCGYIANLALFLLGPASGVMTGSLIDYDQMVIGAYD